MQQHPHLVSIPKSDLDSLEATVETLQDRDVMEHIEASERDIIEGRVKSAREALKEI